MNIYSYLILKESIFYWVISHSTLKTYLGYVYIVLSNLHIYFHVFVASVFVISIRTQNDFNKNNRNCINRKIFADHQRVKSKYHCGHRPRQ